MAWEKKQKTKCNKKIHVDDTALFSFLNLKVEQATVKENCKINYISSIINVVGKQNYGYMASWNALTNCYEYKEKLTANFV